MVKVKKFRKVWPHKRHKRPKKRRSADKRNIPNNLNPLTKENTQSIRIPNSNQCFNSYPNLFEFYEFFLNIIFHPLIAPVFFY